MTISNGMSGGNAVISSSSGGGWNIGDIKQVAGPQYFIDNPDWLPSGVEVDPATYPDIIPYCKKNIPMGSSIVDAATSHKGICLRDDGVGLRCGDSGSLQRTTNYGLSWYDVSSGTSRDLHSVTLLDNGIGLACGAYGTICRTTNHGASWSTASSPVSASGDVLEAVVMNSSGLGLIFEAAYTLVSTNFGSSWVKDNDRRPMRSPTGAAMLDNGILIVVGYYGICLKSLDFGVTYKGIVTPAPLFGVYNADQTMPSIALREDGFGLTSTYNLKSYASTMLATFDFGETWTPHPTPEKWDFNSNYVSGIGLASNGKGVVALAGGGAILDSVVENYLHSPLVNSAIKAR